MVARVLGEIPAVLPAGPVVVGISPLRVPPPRVAHGAAAVEMTTAQADGARKAPVVPLAAAAAAVVDLSPIWTA